MNPSPRFWAFALVLFALVIAIGSGCDAPAADGSAAGRADRIPRSHRRRLAVGEGRVLDGDAAGAEPRRPHRRQDPRGRLQPAGARGAALRGLRGRAADSRHRRLPAQEARYPRPRSRWRWRPASSRAISSPPASSRRIAPSPRKTRARRCARSRSCSRPTPAWRAAPCSPLSILKAKVIPEDIGALTDGPWVLNKKMRMTDIDLAMGTLTAR